MGDGTAFPEADVAKRGDLTNRSLGTSAGTIIRQRGQSGRCAPGDACRNHRGGRDFKEATSGDKIHGERTLKAVA
jgi:hypothetical protein